jgi:selenocysteine lyase/cysteine desulfurase
MENTMDWQALRRECPVTGQWAYLDHAAVAPLTERARRAMDAWAKDMAENGEVNAVNWDKRVEEVRSLAGKLLSADPLDLAFVKNTSEGIGWVAEGIRWKAGDNVVTAAEEYPSNIYPWLNLSALGVEVRQVATRDRRISIDDLRAAIDGRTRLVTLSAVEFASGYRNDLAAVGEICRQRGIYFFVDAIQQLGVMQLSARELPVDFLCADGHKWMLGPQGAGIFYIRRNLVDWLHPVSVGWNSVVASRDFSRVDFRLKPNAGRWENGTLNFAGITGMGASLELLLEIGLDVIAARVIELTDYLCERWQAAGFEVYSPRQGGEKSGIVSLISPVSNPRALVRLCREARIVINQRSGRIRISPHCYNTVEEIDQVVDLLKKNSF